MKILVTLKRVIDPYMKIRFKPDKSGVDNSNIKMILNPFDEIALEESIRLREANVAETITVVTIGNDACQETLRHALALGADCAILVRTSRDFCSLNIAKILHKIISTEKPDLVLMGKQSTDSDNSQTPQMLAGLLNWPQATFVSEIKIKNKVLAATREIDSGLETLNLCLPAVISADLRLNEPRYASLINIMKAKNKPLTIVEYDQLQLDLKEHIEIIEITPPDKKPAGIMVSSVAELLDKLGTEIDFKVI